MTKPMVLCFRKSDVDVAGGDGVACLRVFPAVGLDLNPGAFLVDTSTPGTSQQGSFDLSHHHLHSISERNAILAINHRHELRSFNSSLVFYYCNDDECFRGSSCSRDAIITSCEHGGGPL